MPKDNLLLMEVVSDDDAFIWKGENKINTVTTEHIRRRFINKIQASKVQPFDR